MNKRILLSESEKNRILGIHKNAILKEWNLLNEEDPVNPQNANNEVLLQGTDTDYDYKKVGDKYYFKLKENPTSDAAKGYKTRGKFKVWTPATNQEAIKKISQLPALSTAAAFQAPKVGDGSDEKFDAPVQTVGTTTPSTYPWIENGKASFEALKKSNAADPNFNMFLGQLKTITLDQRRKILQDFKNSGITETSEQPYLVMKQALEDSLRFPEPTTTTTTNTAQTTPSTAATTSSTVATTSSTAATTTNQVKLLDRVPTNKEIRQGFRRRKRLNNRMDRQKRKQLDNLYNQYEQIAGNIQKFGTRDDGSQEFKQQMATLENQMKTINAQIDTLEAT
jgi:hypothetical protein